MLSSLNQTFHFLSVYLVFLCSAYPDINLPLANYTRSPLVVSSYFQNKQRGGHKEIKPILFEPEAQGVF